MNYCFSARVPSGKLALGQAAANPMVQEILGQLIGRPAGDQTPDTRHVLTRLSLACGPRKERTFSTGALVDRELAIDPVTRCWVRRDKTRPRK